MNPFFFAGLAVLALFVWVVGSYFYWRIDRQAKRDRAREGVAPALRLADRWMAEAQERMGKFAEGAEQPLSAAQNDLLELRLEAGRLPQGMKNLHEVRESLSRSLSPAFGAKGLAELVALCLPEGAFRSPEPGLLLLRTPLGEMPCLEAEFGGKPLDEAGMRSLLPRLARLEPGEAAGGFLYFRREEDHRACLANPSWMEGLKARRMMPLDPKGLASLLASLRLSGDVDRLLEEFREGVGSTAHLVGRSERMGEALSTLTASSVKLRAMLEGSAPENLRENLNRGGAETAERKILGKTPSVDAAGEGSR